MTSVMSPHLGVGTAPSAPASSSLTSAGALGTTAAVICTPRRAAVSCDTPTASHRAGTNIHVELPMPVK